MFEDFPNLHPLVVHLPIVLILLSAGLQVLLVIRNWPQVRWVALATMSGGFAGAVAASTYFHAMPINLGPKATAVFAEHEQYAGYTMWLAGITLLLAGIGQYFQLHQRTYQSVVLVAAVAAAGVLSVAGHRGAQLVYVEGVGPKGNLVMKGAHHHDEAGMEAMPGMSTPGADQHDEEGGHQDSDHNAATSQPGAGGVAMPEEKTPAGGAMPGMDMGSAAPSKQAPAGQQPMNGMSGMDVSGSAKPAAQAPSGGAATMGSMPGMEMKGGQNSRPATGKGNKAPAEQMDMGTMPGMSGMDMRPAKSKAKPRATSGMNKEKGMVNMPGMRNMPGMGDMPGMNPAGPKKPGQNKESMGNMPGMKKGETMPGMGDMKDMGDMKGMGSGQAMPGMSMPNPMDKFRFEDNNPARKKITTDKQ